LRATLSSFYTSNLNLKDHHYMDRIYRLLKPRSLFPRWPNKQRIICGAHMLGILVLYQKTDCRIYLFGKDQERIMKKGNVNSESDSTRSMLDRISVLRI